MAATKLLFINQPVSTVAGYTLQGSGPTNLVANAGIQVGVYDASNVLQTTDTSSVTLTLGAGTGTLSGTLVQKVVNGYATFSDLAISTTAGGTNYSLHAADGGLTAADSNTFGQSIVARVNNAELIGTITLTGGANGVGPFRYRAGSSLKGIEISATSTNTTDAVQIYFTEPGQALSTNTSAKPTTIQGGAVLQVGPITCPFHLTMDSNEIGGACDVYLVGTTVTGTITVNLKRMESGGRA